MYSIQKSDSSFVESVIKVSIKTRRGHDRIRCVRNNFTHAYGKYLTDLNNEEISNQLPCSYITYSHIN